MPRPSLHRPSPAGASAPSPLSEYLVAKEPGRLGATLCRNVSYLDEQSAPAFLPSMLEL